MFASRSRAAVAGLLAGAALLASGCDGPPGATARPASSGATSGATFVGRDACVGCHEVQSGRFTGSDHDLAMQPADADTVLGDFDDAVFEHAGVESRFFMKDGAPCVRTDGPGGAVRDFPIAYTFGVRPLQQYLIATEGGRYQALGIAWDARPAAAGGQRWFHLYPGEQIDHRDPLHWTAPLQNWNHMCAECHSTRLRKNYRPDDDRFETTWSAIDVSCEACHGPGSRHVALAQAAARGDAVDAAGGLAVRLRVPDESVWVFDDDAPTARRAQPLASNPQVDACGRCHARRSQVADHVHGRPLADSHRVALLDEGLYHADGQILDEVYVYGSFLQSRMFHAGVTCTDCHEPHGLALRAEGNALCGRCHRPDVFDTPAHHHHAAGSPGAECVACHMPVRRFMVIDPRRDHSFRVPRPDLGVRLGTPNACNGCHAEQDAAWAQDAVVAWYGAARGRAFHYGEALDAGRRREPGAARLLRRVADDPEMPGIARATAVGLLRDAVDAASIPAIIRAARDRNVLLRRAAADLLDALDVRTRVHVGRPLLDDPARTVRTAAAAALAGVPAEAIDEAGREALARALTEHRDELRFNADRAESRVNLGNLEASLGRAADAERAYRRAIAIDPAYVPASVNLADLLRALGREAEGERVLRDALEAAPDVAATHHALGLLLVRVRRPTDALDHFARAAELAPDEARYAFVHAVALHDLGRSEAAIAALVHAHGAAPSDRDVLLALVNYNVELGRRAEALRWARRLAELSPGDPAAARLVERLRG